jgi:hypothetical protein
MSLYLTIEDALKRARERADAGAEANEYLRELLFFSAGKSKSTGAQVFRPFYCAAKYLEQSRADQTLTEADGAKFTGQALPIKSLFDLQASIDLGLDVPIGFECYPIATVTASKPTLAERAAAYNAAKRSLIQYQPRRGPSS